MDIKIENAEVMREHGGKEFLKLALDAINTQTNKNTGSVHLTTVPRNEQGVMCWPVVIISNKYEKRHISLLSQSTASDFTVI